MSGVPGRSGGRNKLPLEIHRSRGTLRPARHLTPAPPVPHATVSPEDRRRTLRGLPPGARRIAASLLSEYRGWDAASLEVLRSYVLSCERLSALHAEPGDDARAIHREIRANALLLKHLDLEKAQR